MLLKSGEQAQQKARYLYLAHFSAELLAAVYFSAQQTARRLVVLQTDRKLLGPT